MHRPLAAAALCSLVLGCAPIAPTATVSVPASATVAPGSEAPSAPPSEPPSDPPGAGWADSGSVPLVRNSAATVIVASLPARFDASPDADSAGVFVRGDVVELLVFEPLEFNGASWYYVIKVSTSVPGRMPDLPAVPQDDDEFALRGWVAATDATGAATLALLLPRCPAVRDFANVSAMLRGERLACFGAAAIKLEGTYSCAGCTGQDQGTWEPAWLADTAGGKLSDPSLGERRRLLLNVPPLVTAPDEGARVRVTGHFDDPLAATCRLTLDGVEAPRAFAVAWCRLQFVVESFEVRSAE